MAAPRVFIFLCVALCILLLWHWISVSNSAAYITKQEPIQLMAPVKDEAVKIRQSGDCTFSETVQLPGEFLDPCSDSQSDKFLREKLVGSHVCPNSAEEYFTHYSIFNTAISIKPKLVVMPFAIPDIQLTLKVARRLNLTVTVRNGGHNPAGFSLSEGGLVIDMAYIKKVRYADEPTGVICDDFWNVQPVKPVKNSIVAQGGAIWAEIHPLLDARHVEIVGGGCPSVGVVGLALGGGIGWTSRRYGLVSDHMRSLRMVLPNGNVRVVDEKTNPDLMLALRGAGGSNFGVVTDVVLDTQPAYDSYLAGSFTTQRSRASTRPVLQAYIDTIITANVDTRLTVDLFLSARMPFNNASASLISITVSAFFDGSIEDGLVVLQPFLDRLSEILSTRDFCLQFPLPCEQSDGSPEVPEQGKEWIRSGGPFLQKKTFTDWAAAFNTPQVDSKWTSGFVNEWNDEITNHVLDVLEYKGITEYLSESEYVQMFVTLEHVGGAIGKGPSLWKHTDAIALFSIEAMAAPLPPFQVTPERRRLRELMKNWCMTVYRRLLPYFTGSYSNYAFDGMEDWEEKYYGNEAYLWLVQVKSRFHDADLFNSAQRIAIENPERPRDTSNPYWRTVDD